MNMQPAYANPLKLVGLCIQTISQYKLYNTPVYEQLPPTLKEIITPYNYFWENLKKTNYDLNAEIFRYYDYYYRSHEIFKNHFGFDNNYQKKLHKDYGMSASKFNNTSFHYKFVYKDLLFYYIRCHLINHFKTVYNAYSTFTRTFFQNEYWSLDNMRTLDGTVTEYLNHSLQDEAEKQKAFDIKRWLIKQESDI